jgi:hypothetical protein
MGISACVQTGFIVMGILVFAENAVFKELPHNIDIILLPSHLWYVVWIQHRATIWTDNEQFIAWL